MLKSYLNRIADTGIHGDAREESYYPALADLFMAYAEANGKKDIRITTLPKKTEAGNPDFRVWDGNQHIVGYIEAKAPTVDYLDQIETTGQLKRYLHTFPNLILTNFFEFRLYRNGVLIQKVQLARPFVIHKLKNVPPVEHETELLSLLEKYFSFSLPKVYDAKTLAIELAKRTRFLRDEVVAQELEDEEKKGKGFIIGFYEAFRKYLISGLSKEEFADLYSQTITYGLFAARTRSENGFNRKLAYDRIPRTIGILRDVFQFVSLGELPKPMEWIVDDISEVLAVTDVKSLLRKYFHEGKGKDPIVHFYETFLAEYDPKTREMRGVYYTPEPVVSYIVRSLNSILKEHFNKRSGFASESVTVLDPAAGTLTFLAEAAKLVVEDSLSFGKDAGAMAIKEYILPNFYAFELMMAPYAIGHLKMSFLLEELGYKLQPDERFKLYLTNTLEMNELAQTELPGMASLSEESHLAGEVKKQQPILVILGNPPYSGHSTNVYDEVKAYYQIDGKPLGEKNSKWLQDDYVKFIRFAQWKIDQAGEGVLGFITNHSYLDNPTFRGMRRSLMNSFDEIYILDLHGNSLKKEKAPDGSKDENVFDIQQGVAIALFIKKKDKDADYSPMYQPSSQIGLEFEKETEEKADKEKKECVLHHAELWGLREKKYAWLDKNSSDTTKWKMLKPKSEFYLFIPRDEKLLKTYERFMKITDVFPVNSVGIVTSRDGFVIDENKAALKRRIRMFTDPKMPDEIIGQTFNLQDKPNWKLKDARETVMKDEHRENAIRKILYRPFDVQWVFYHDAVIERSRREVMRHMEKENLAMISPRQSKEQPGAFVTTNIAGHKTVSAFDINYFFPLYLYPEKEKPKKRSSATVMMVFDEEKEYKTKKPNLSAALIERLTSSFKKTPSPEHIFFYTYAVLYSNTYRTKHAEFLKSDFPRIPFTSNYKLFTKMAGYGERLVDLHLLKSSDLDSKVVSMEGKGNGKVEKVRYEKNKVYISDQQYIEGVSPTVWEYQVGGYQVCDKWLKDRKGKILSLENMKHYSLVVAALKKTMDIQDKIDGLYADVEKEIIDPI